MHNRISHPQTQAVDPAHIGRLVEANLTSWAEQTLRELAMADREGRDTGPYLAIGLSVLRARQDVRAGIRDAERESWRATK